VIIIIRREAVILIFVADEDVFALGLVFKQLVGGKVPLYYGEYCKKSFLHLVGLIPTLHFCLWYQAKESIEPNGIITANVMKNLIKLGRTKYFY
jgi:hypothetical protein